MDASTEKASVTRINPGCFSRAGVENEASQIEVRLSRYGNGLGRHSRLTRQCDLPGAN